MAIAFDAASSTLNGGSPHSFTHTCASGAVLIVFASDMGGTETVTGVTYNGTALTQLLATTDDSGAGLRPKGSAWMLHNPSSGSNTVEVTFSGPNDYHVSIAVSYTGVVNTSVAAAHRTIYHAGEGGAGGGANVTVVDSQSGDVVVSHSTNYGVTLSAGTGMTSRRDQLATDTYDTCAQDVSASGANTVINFTNDDYCTNIAFALIPSGGGGASAGGPLIDYSPLVRGALSGTGRLVA